MNKKKLKKRIILLKQERKELYQSDYRAINAEMAAMAISDIEYEIVAIEDCLDFERRMLPFRISLYAFIIISIVLTAYVIFK